MVPSCSVNEPTGHAGSTHHQVCLRQMAHTCRSKLGASTSGTSRLPRKVAITPQRGHPATPSSDVSASPAQATSIARCPDRPTSRSHREQYVESWRHAVVQGSRLGHVEVSLVATRPEGLDPHHPAATPNALRPTSTRKSPQTGFKQVGITHAAALGPGVEISAAVGGCATVACLPTKRVCSVGTCAHVYSVEKSAAKGMWLWESRVVSLLAEVAKH